MTSAREAQILELRLRKIPFEKIAQTVGITKSAARKGYYRALRRVPLRYAKDIVTEEAEALDRMESRLWREIEKSGIDVKHVTTVVHRMLGIQQRRARLLGLDAPQRIDMSILKPATDESAHAPGQEQQMIERLTAEEKRNFLALLSKMSASFSGK